MRYFSQLPSKAQLAFLHFRTTLLECERRPDVEACLVSFARWYEHLRWLPEAFERAFGQDDADAGRVVVEAIIADRGGRSRVPKPGRAA
uniref:Uncharacterized protein n=1 Tax=Bosea sp. NBC_00436 TaxID=2969620 RepID=A0A9E7ZWR2_9HYPH